MPQFAPGVAKTAIAPIVAKPSGMSCEAELFLGPDDATKVVSSGRVPFVSTGAAKNVSLPITMPGAPGSYHGYIDVFAGGLRFLAYRLTEDVVIAAPVAPPFTMTVINPQMIINKQATAWRVIQFEAIISNPHSVAVSHRLRPAYRYAYQGDLDNPSVYASRYWSNAQQYIDLTLAPGQSITLLSPFFYISVWNDFFQSYEWANPPMVGTSGGEPRMVWLRVLDENNNMSPRVSIGTYVG